MWRLPPSEVKWSGKGLDYAWHCPTPVQTQSYIWAQWQAAPNSDRSFLPGTLASLFWAWQKLVKNQTTLDKGSELPPVTFWRRDRVPPLSRLPGCSQRWHQESLSGHKHSARSPVAWCHYVSLGWGKGGKTSHSQSPTVWARDAGLNQWRRLLCVVRGLIVTLYSIQLKCCIVK